MWNLAIVRQDAKSNTLKKAWNNAWKNEKWYETEYVGENCDKGSRHIEGMGGWMKL